MLHFKAWCTSQWEADAYEPIQLLHTMPTDVPELIKRNNGVVDIPKLRSMVDKCKTNGIFKSEERDEWMTVLDSEQVLADQYENVEERNVGG